MKSSWIKTTLALSFLGAVLTAIVVAADSKPEAQVVNDYWASALAKRDQGDLNGAIADFTKVIQLRPTYRTAYSLRGQTEMHLGVRLSGLADSENQADFLQRFAVMSNLWNAAWYDHCQAIRLKPDDAEGYYFRATSVQVLYPESGLKDYDEAIRLKPDYDAAYFGRGELRMLRTNWDGALKDFDQAITLNPTNSLYAIAYWHRGILRKAKGDAIGAQADHQMALHLDPLVESKLPHK